MSESMSVEELVAIVSRIMRGDYTTEAEADALVERFARNVPHPRASDLIFFPMDEFGHEPTPEQVVERALRYRPTEL